MRTKNYLRTIPNFFLFAKISFISLILAQQSSGTPLLNIPMQLPAPSPNKTISITNQNISYPLTIRAEIQEGLERFLVSKNNPIAGAMVVDAKTGEILAMSQGKPPSEWNSKVHTTLHAYFPAASVFKTVTTAAALELAKVNPDQGFPMTTSCGEVQPNGRWFEGKPSRAHEMTLRHAFAGSCNSFFAMMAMRYLGLGVITQFAEQFGWKRGIGADFKTAVSPLLPPEEGIAGIHTVGRFAAGFGKVGMSVAHAAWLTLAIANQGVPKDLKIISPLSQSLPAVASTHERIFSPETSQAMLEIMNRTVMSGTASSAFAKGPYRMLRTLAGGKTGTLHGDYPEGLTTWFTGVYPYDDPQVIVSAVVVNDSSGRWYIKASNLAAEALRLWYQRQLELSRVASSPLRR